MTQITYYDIRVAGEWAEFFVRESSHDKPDGTRRHTATWCCHSSFGVFGHHWYDMGQPFAVFIRDTEPDYVLSKIARRVASAEKAIAGVRSSILDSRRGQVVTREAARDAWDAVAAIEAEGHSGEVTCSLLYESSEIDHCEIEWSDLTTMEWDDQAMQFMRKLWPAFVAKFTPAQD